MAHITVNSDGVRSGEESMLGVSRGQIKAPATTKDLVQAMIIRDREQIPKIVEQLESISVKVEHNVAIATANARAQNERFELHIREYQTQSELLQEILRYLSDVDTRTAWRRFTDFIFGREK